MGFSIITGTMGGGKSYLGAELAIQAFREGALVHSNLEFIHERIIEEGWRDQFIPLPDEPSGWMQHIRAGEEGRENLVVIDEAALALNARDWQKNQSQNGELFEFLVWSRKFGLDVYFISQAQKNVDANLRRMAQTLIRCVATKKVPIVGPILRVLKGDFLRVTKSPDDRTVMGVRWKRFDSFVGGIYRTDSTHGRFSGVKRDVRRGAKSDEDVRGIKKWAVVGVVALVMVGWRVYAGGATLANRVEARRAPESPRASAEVVAAAPGEPRFRVRGGSGRDHEGRSIVWIDGQTVRIGSVFEEGVVRKFSRTDDILTIVLDDGRQIETRPATSRELEKSWQNQSQSPGAFSGASRQGGSSGSLFAPLRR